MAENTPVTPAAGTQQLPIKMLPMTAPPDELYVDGAFSILNRGGVVKIDLYRVAGYERGAGNTATAELRQHSHRLVLPVNGLLELAAMLQRAVETLGAARQDAAGARAGTAV